jgi:hypothetical protein
MWAPGRWPSAAVARPQSSIDIGVAGLVALAISVGRVIIK